MNKKLILGSIALSALLAGAQVYTGLSKPTENLQSINIVDHSVLPVMPEARINAKQDAKRTVASRGFFYEDFESCDGQPPYTLPEGWTTSGEGWRGGTITLDGSPLQGVSGMKYAFIFANGKTASDAWAFSPKIEMEAGKTYQIQFYSLGVTTTDIEEALEIKIGRSAAPAEMTMSLGETGDTDSYWRKIIYTFTPEETASYNIGFHSTTPLNKENASGMIIDDLKVYTGAIPVFNSESTLDFGTVGDLEPAIETTLIISNYGNADMNVSLADCSDNLTIDGLPALVEAYEECGVKVILKPEGLGKYEGFITLATDDPAAPEVTVNVTANVEKSRITGYIVEDFEAGGPDGWSFSTGCVNTADYPGYASSSRCVYTNTYYIMLEGNDDGVGFTTHYVEMGDAPVISFWYKLTDASFFGGGAPTEPERALVKIYVNELGADGWTKAFEISEDGDRQHIASDDYAKASFDLSAFAGKTCKIRILFSQPDADDAMALMMNSIEAFVDNVEIGTPIKVDLGADFLIGNGAVTVGEEIMTEVEITNYGAEDVENYKVGLYSASGDELITTVEGTPVAAGEAQKLQITWSPEAVGATAVYAIVEADEDNNTANDRSNTLSIDVLSSDNKTTLYDEGKKLLSSAFPINFGEVESITQSIYPANDFGINRAVISSLVYTSEMNAAFKSESFEVFVGETSKETFDDSTPIALDALIKVFEGTMCFPKGTYAVTVPFATPYEYHGGNLVVMCRKLGKEFVNNRNFIIHKTAGLQSLQCYASEPGTLTDDLQGARIIATAVLPEITFNFTAAEPASLRGCVTSDGNALKNVRVSIDGSGLYTFTDANGIYTFSRLVEDSYALKGELHGFHRSSKNDITVSLDGENVCDIEMTPLAVHTVSGTVTEAGTKRAVEGASVLVNGYDSYVTVTDADGKFSISGVYEPDDVQSYTIRIRSPFFEHQAASFNLTKDITSDFELSGLALRPNDVTALTDADGVKVTWTDPSAELRYDTGVLKEGLGYPTGWEQIIFGTVYRTDASVTEVSWYLTDENADHSNLNVFIFALDEAGNPDPDNILYRANDVGYTDNEWSYHKLPQAVKSEGGFMVALSCNGFMGIGVTEPSEAYPFETGMHFYAGQSYKMMISDMSDYRPLHLMLRATIDGMDNATRPTACYDVYRVVDDCEKDEWTLLGTTSEKVFLDSDAAQFANRKLRYAVVSKIGDSEAPAVLSNDLNTTAIKEIQSNNEVKIIVSDGLLRVESEIPVAKLELYNLTGICMARTDTNELKVNTLAAGIYLIKATTVDQHVNTSRFIKK